ncbi:hypothetical protein BEL04_15650 [Mucilaginibacter sp. PPCGB 2223]|uniref:hypothetical protein n=1 Tax=Mucilaginibacter sp. PPCGB 2223 TaxID=1886027 RepID=UPI000826234C|nr:hypothetical protein [Mucilaginibacter sp. PPCGB 2223]OCX51460.1 hypothetical protein BEL04_15650 [Mucilaginibacter sp. PPCGB 2223]
MWNNRHLIRIFYKPIFIISILFSCGSVRLVQLAGWSFLLMALLLKISGYGLIMGYQYLMSQKTFYYYRNAGVSMRMMYLQTYTFDFAIYTIMLILLYLFK